MRRRERGKSWRIMKRSRGEYKKREEEEYEGKTGKENTQSQTSYFTH
jgi:hypothetical protein